MEGETRDPYEDQLLAVFNSCLEEGETKLRFDGLRSLCHKLQLEERSKELISYLLEPKEAFISFKTFRDSLVKLLGQSYDNSDGSCVSETANHSLNQSQSIKNESWKTFSGKVNGAINGEIDHSEMCGLSGSRYPTIPKEMLEQIFEKLDMDCDGLISFDEFVLLFENEKNPYDQLSHDWVSVTSSEAIKSRDHQNIVHMFGPHQTGYARISSIASMWEVAGVSDAATLLSDLGFTTTEIRLTDLTTVLCEELKNLRDEPDNVVSSTHMRLLKGALTLYQEEVRCMNILVEHLSGERDKLRIDVAEANERANLLAQEIDEHHVRLEKSRQEQLKQLELKHAEITKDLSIQCTSEREVHTAALKTLDRQLQVVQHEEQQVRTKLANVLHENQSLEAEVETLMQQITKLKLSNDTLTKRVQHLEVEHEEVETCEDPRESEQIIMLVERIKHLQAEAALLRDQNDEITAELEFTKRCNEGKSVMPPEDTFDKTKVEPHTPEESSEFSEVSSNEWCKNVTVDDIKLSDLSNVIGTIVRELRSLLNAKTQCTADYCAFRSNISNIITGLETNLSRVSKPTNLSKEPEVECEERTSESLRDLVVSQTLVKRKSHSDDTINNIDKNFNNLISKNKFTSLRDYPPRKDDDPSKSDKNNVSLNITQGSSGDNDESMRESMKLVLQEQEAKHINEKKQLNDRCTELERSLDLLRAEYEQCEDYWAAKLEEERQLFEQEQKISDDKFSELITKMAEYEEQFSPGDKSRTDGRLSPIEEKFNLEQQYADLEDEFEELKIRSSELLSLKDAEIKELQEKLSNEKPLVDESTQISFEETETDGVFKPASSSTTLSMNSTNEQQHCQTAATKKIVHYTANHKMFDPSKLNQIKETAVSNSSLYSQTSPKFRETYCPQSESYAAIDELCRINKIELHRLHQKRLEIDRECLNLSKQKESLMKGVSELRNIEVISHLCSNGDTEDPTCLMNINVLKSLNDKLHVQEKKRKNLKISMALQQQRAENILQQTWKQHLREVTALRCALQNTKDKLKKQIQTNQEQTQRLTEADVLSMNLYIQNAHLMVNIKQLEEHCQMLSQFTGESTSV